MIWRGQDKGHGPKWPKPLSAHLFLRDAARKSRDVVSNVLPVIAGDLAGTQAHYGVLDCCVSAGVP